MTTWGSPWKRQGPRLCAFCRKMFPSYDWLSEHRCGGERQLVWPQSWPRRAR